MFLAGKKVKLSKEGIKIYGNNHDEGTILDIDENDSQAEVSVVWDKINIFGDNEAIWYRKIDLVVTK